MTNMEEKPEFYFEEATVNGINYGVGWDSGYRDYTVYFPGIELNEAAHDKGVWDQVIRISDDREEAKKVFDRTGEIAKEEKDVYKVFLQVVDYVNDLTREKE
jgi:hypothetical protein